MGGGGPVKMPLLSRPPNCQQVWSKFVAPLGFSHTSLRTQVRVSFMGSCPLHRLDPMTLAIIGGWGEGTPLLVSFMVQVPALLASKSGVHDSDPCLLGQITMDMHEVL